MELENNVIISYCEFTTEIINNDAVNGEVITLKIIHDDGRDIRVIFPDFINKIILHERYNRSISHMVWPAELNILVFGDAFDQDISKMSWSLCMNLYVMKFGYAFNQDFYNMTWPPMLHTLHFNGCSDKDIGIIPTLKHVEFVYGSMKDTHDIEKFTALNFLRLGDLFNQDISDTIFPMSLDTLIFGLKFTQDISKVDFKNISVIGDYSCRISIESNAFKTIKYIIHYIYVECMDIYRKIITYERPTGGHTKAALHSSAS
jgi:hypothetical protein